VIWAVILAAGESRRMGRQKLLLPFGDTTVVGAVVRAAQASHAGRTLVVLGSDREAVRGELEASGPGHEAIRAEAAPLGNAGVSGPGPILRIEFAVNENYPQGMLTSIQTGLKALPADAQAAVVLLGDQPFLASRVIDEVIAAYETGRNGIVIPTFQGRRGHPVLIDIKYRDEVLAIDPAEGLRRLMLAHPDDILELGVADSNILRDLDTPEDYQEGIKPRRGGQP
jgi:molybdenum cofactor cytidylyltransferase